MFHDPTYKHMENGTPSPVDDALVALSRVPVEALLAEVARRVLPEIETAPTHLALELCTGRLSLGYWSAWLRDGDHDGGERAPMSYADAIGLIEELARSGPDSTLTLGGVGDPLMHPRALDLVRAAKAAGVAGVHLRTDLLRTDVEPETLIASGVDVISVDVLAVSPEGFAGLHGQDRHGEVVERVSRLAELSIERGAGGLPCPWVVPRLTRSDETYHELEAFYDSWILAAGSAVIDPHPTVVPGARIAALPLPRLARERLNRSSVSIRSDGVMVSGDGSRIEARASGGLLSAWNVLRRSLRGGPEIGVHGARSGTGAA